jgi:hypothetical protein
MIFQMFRVASVTKTFTPKGVQTIHRHRHLVHKITGGALPEGKVAGV